MRTLKKTLCLVLCLAMMAGLCAVCASAAFTDAEEITYKEAVDVMSGIGVIKGIPQDDGTVKFDPQGTLTRASACAIIARMLGDGDIKATSTFTDCQGHWGESEIAYCAAQGIVAGKGDGTFGPDELLTGSAWAKMVLVALGYDADENGMTGADWEIGVAKLLKTTKLAAAIKGFDATKAIPREEACVIAFQGLQYSVSGETVYVVDGITDLTFDDFLTAFIASGNDAAKVHKSIPTDTLATNVFGLGQNIEQDDNGFAYYNWYAENKAKNVISDNYYTDTIVAEFASETAYKAIAAELGITGKEATAIPADYYVNGVKKSVIADLRTYVTDTTKMPAGVTAVVAKNAAGGYKLMVTVTYVVAANAGVKQTSGDHKGEYEFTLGGYSAAKLYGATDKDYVGYYAVVPAGDNMAATEFLSCEKVTPVEAKAAKYTLNTSSKLATVTVDGTAYTAAATADATVTGATSVPFDASKAYYVVAGYLYHIGDPATDPDVVYDGYVYVAATQVAYKKGADSDLFKDGTTAEAAAKAMIVTTAGESKIVDLAVTEKKVGNATKFYFNNEAGTETEISDNVALTAKNVWAAYTEKDGVYTLYALPTATTKTVASLGTAYAKKTASLEGKYMSADTTFTYINTKDVAVKNVTGYANIEIKAGAQLLIVFNSKNVVTAVYQVKATTDVAGSTATYAYASAKGATVAAGDEWTFFVDGEAKTMVVKLAADTEYTVNTLAEGKVYDLRIDAKGIVTGAKTETTVPAGREVKMVEATYAVFGTDTITFAPAGYKVYNITTGTPGTADVLEVGDYAAVIVGGDGAASLIYIVNKP